MKPKHTGRETCVMDGEPVAESRLEALRVGLQTLRMSVGSRRRKSTKTEDDGWVYTAKGKRRRRHPVAEVKGNWTPEEDAKLIECERHAVPSILL